MDALRSVLILLICGLAAGTSIAPPEPSCREERERVQTLARGTIEEVWAMFDDEEGGPDFWSIDDDEETSLDACRESLLAGITRAVSRTDDARIAARALDEIEFGDLVLFEPILRAALAHPSPAVRRHAARRAADAQDPALAAAIEETFRAEVDEGVRRDLVRALARLESHKFLPELREMAESPDAASRDVALDALTWLPDPQSIELLESIAMSEAPPQVILEGIIDALAGWKDIPTAGAALRKIGREGPGEAASTAIRRLSRPLDNDLAALVEIASIRSSDEDPGLRNLALLGIDLIATNEPAETVTLNCGGGRWIRGLPLVSGSEEEFGNRTSKYVAPSGTHGSARCWDAPGFMWPGEIRPRVPTGEYVVVLDEFPWQDETWFAVVNPGHFCWMRESDLSDDEPAPVETDGLLEVDVPEDDADSWAARALEARGWSTRFDEENSVVGIRLEADLARETVADLVRIRLLSDSPAISHAVGRWLYEYARLFRVEDELREGIPRRDPRWDDESDESDDEPEEEPKEP